MEQTAATAQVNAQSQAKAQAKLDEWEAIATFYINASIDDYLLAQCRAGVILNRDGAF